MRVYNPPRINIRHKSSFLFSLVVSKKVGLFFEKKKKSFYKLSNTKIN